MLPDDVVRLPAGWYPDPTGLPQLRWWDNHAWTQHTAAARQPLIVQESPLAWADDLPTRRERRERERESSGTDDLTPPTAQTLLELAPPSEDDEPADNPAPDDHTVGSAPEIEVASASASDEDFDADDVIDESAFVPLSASGHAGRIPSIPPLEAAETEAPVSPQPHLDAGAPSPSPSPVISAPPTAFPATVGTPLFDQVVAGVTGPPPALHWDEDRPGTPHHDNAQSVRTGAVDLSTISISTMPAWIIALVPLIQLVIVLLLVTGLGSSPATELAIPAILVVIYLVSCGLAYGDSQILRGAGISKPAHWTWSLLTAPVYLFVRAMVLTRTTGRGFGPVLTWFALALLSAASLLAVPGMLITALPTTFSAQAEQSIQADATANGASLDISCPPSPPIIIGQGFTCTAKTDSGKTYKIDVSLQRINGWIDWRVDDWGVNTLSR